MLQITPPTTPCKNTEKRKLARLRRLAKPRGFRVLKDWSQTWFLVDAKIAPPRALIGLFHVSLSKIETALLTPLPPPQACRAAAEADQPPADGAPEITTVTDLFMRLGGAS
jgi:hypothetical protein